MTASFSQVSFFEESIAKVRKDSKKRITWVFRVVSTGYDREHSVTLTWSTKSGKQEVEMDGDEQVFFGRRRGASVFDSRWETKTQVPMKLHILATSAPPLSDGFRCFDLIINGQVFAHMPQYNGAEGLPAPVMEPSVDGKPKSIFEIIYPNGYPACDAVPSAEQRQPEQPSASQAIVPAVAPQSVQQPRVQAEPVDLLSM
ncbi:MAG: hypothetical protein SGARI_003712 [Bacillariaceae sp.]